MDNAICNIKTPTSPKSRTLEKAQYELVRLLARQAALEYLDATLPSTRSIDTAKESKQIPTPNDEGDSHE